MKKRIVSLLLAAIMVFSILPTSVFALSETEDEELLQEGKEHSCSVLEPSSEASSGEASSGEDASNTEIVEESAEILSATTEVKLPMSESTEEMLSEETIFETGSGDNILTMENFPDRTLRRMLQAAFPEGLTAAQAASYTTFPVYIVGYGIEDLSGVTRFFTGLTALDCSYNYLSSLDVSSLASLTKLDCSHNSLTELVLENPVLTNLECSNNMLTELKVPGKVQYLKCNYNNLTSINLSEATVLEDLYCSYNNFTELSIPSACKKLSIMNCSHCSLTALDISSASSLQILWCSHNKFTEFITIPTSNMSLHTVDFSYNTLTALELTDPYLNSLNVSHCGLRTLDISKVTYLTTLNCSYNNFTELSIPSDCRQLMNVDCSHNNLTALDISTTRINQLNCAYNDIASLVLSNVTSTLNCNFNCLTELDLSADSRVTNLTCADNKLVKLTLHKNTKTVDCSRNCLISVDASQCTYLTAENFTGTGQHYTDSALPAVEMGEKYVTILSGELSSVYDNLTFDNGTDLGNGLVACDSADALTVSIILKDYRSHEYSVSGDLPLQMETLALNKEHTIVAVGGIDHKIAFTLPATMDFVNLDVAFLVDGEPTEDYLDMELLQEGILHPLKGGTGRIVFTLFVEDSVSGDVYESKQEFRLDILDESNPDTSLTGISLTLPKQTVELYSSNYPELGILVEFDKLLKEVAEHGNGEEIATAPAVCFAKFTNEEAAGWFDLQVINNRTLRIVPTQAAINAALENKSAVKSSYKSTISITVEGYAEPFTTGLLTLSVKQTKPVLKAKAVVLNSYAWQEDGSLNYASLYEAVPVVITGGTVTELADTGELPAWLNGTVNDGLIYFQYAPDETVSTPNAKISTTVTAKLMLSGWRIPAAVSIKVSTKPIEPKLSFSANSVSLTEGSTSVASVTAKLKTAQYEGYPLELVSITEAVNKQTVTCENGEAISVVWTPYGYSVAITAENADTGTAHSYTLTWKLAGKTFFLRVKTNPMKPVTLKFTVSGSLDSVYDRGYYPFTAVTIRPNISNVSKIKGVYPGVFVWRVTKVSEKKNGNIETSDASSAFNLSAMEPSGVMYLECKTPTISYSSDDVSFGFVLSLGYEYSPGCYAEYSNVVPMRVFKAANVKYSMKLRATGAIDLLRPDSCVTLTPKYSGEIHMESFTNRYTFYKKAADGTWKQVANAPFRVEEEVVGIPEFTAADLNGSSAPYSGKAYKIARIYATDTSAGTEKYKVIMACSTKNGRGYEAEAMLTVKTGKVVVTANPAAAVLLLKDRYDVSAPITLSYSDSTLAGIDHVELDSNSEQLFRLIDLGGNQYALGWKDNTIPTNLKANSVKTVKLQIFMCGSITAKPTTTATIKITAAAQPTG